jgi:ribose transport system permease protein
LFDASISNVSLRSVAETSRHRRAVRWGFVLLLPLLIVAMALAVSLFEPRVLSLRNIINILVQSSYLLLFASAQMVVILTGGFDLSLGMTVSVISVATALVTTGLAAADAPAWLVLIAGLAVGLGIGVLVGTFNGLFVSWVGINPFVVTLGSLNICYGLATTISGGRPVFNVPDAFTGPLYDGTFIPGVPVPVTLAILVAVFLYLLLDHTVFGRALYLIGNNPRAANLAGIPGRRYLFLAYVTCSFWLSYAYRAHRVG